MECKKSAKGFYGILLQKLVLKQRYNIDHNPKNSGYDLTSSLNKLTHKNVSIKSSQSNIIFCSDIFNFLSSVSLELIVIQYKISNINHVKKLIIKKGYLFNDLDSFFKHINNLINLIKLKELHIYIKSLSYPYSNEQRILCHKMAKTVISINNPYGFRINCKLSSSNKRIQCSISLKKISKLIKFKTIKFVDNTISL